MNMPKWLMWTLGIILLVIFMVGGIYNNLISKDQNVAQNWAQIENQLQRRFDLIPNLVATVKGYATHERTLFDSVAKARSAWADAKTSSDKMAAAGKVEGFLGRLIAVAEAYPQLQASENFRALQDELAGTENRIAIARMRYNEAVEAYNIAAKRVPGVFFVKLFRFDREKPFFKVKEEGAKKAPKITF